jgi:hypothetical protein
MFGDDARAQIKIANSRPEASGKATEIKRRDQKTSGEAAVTSGE